MSELTVDDGYAADGPTRTSSFDYTGLRYDFVHRASLGFAEVTTREVSPAGEALRTTRETYANRHQWEAGLLTRTEVHTGEPGQDTLLAATDTVWTVFRGATGQPMTAADVAAMDPEELLSVWARPLPTQQTTTRVIAGRVTASQVETSYDQLGAPATQRDLGDPGVSSDDVTTVTTYSTCATSASTVLRSECGLPAKAEQRSPFASAQSCPTWVHLPVSVTVLDDQARVLRETTSPENVCGLGTPTRIAERTGRGAQNEVDPVFSTGSGTGWAVTRVALDAWGNPARVIHPPADNGRHYAQADTYDPATHTVVVASADFDLSPAQAEAFLADGTEPTDPATRGVTASAVYDPRLQRITSRVDANGVMTLWRYDALGRTLQVRLPDSRLLHFRYQPTAIKTDGTQAGAGFALPYATVRNHNLVTHTLTDGLGKVVQTHTQTETQSQAGSGTRAGFTVSGAVDYDALGRPVREWHPTFVAAGPLDPPVLSTVRAATDPASSRYNVLDEPVGHTDHNGATTSWSRTIGRDEGTGLMLLTTVETGPEGRGTATATDSRGLVRVNTDLPEGGPAVVTRYDVDVLGQLRRVSQAGVVQQTNAYDLQGRRIATTSTDGGRIDFGYDPFGNLTSRQSPNQRAAGAGVATTYTHAFGAQLRMIDHPDSTPDVHYEYGGYGGASAEGHTAGRVRRVVDGAKDQRLTYDLFGQVLDETTTLRHPKWGHGAVTTTYRSDWLGRLTSVTLPGGEIVSYAYDGGGRLTSVTGTLEGETTSYLRNRRYDALGAITTETLGNGITTGFTWDPATRWLSGQTSVGPDDAGTPGAGAELADLAYTYDKAGNVLGYRNDVPAAAGGPSRQVFTLDGAYRITAATGDWDYAAGKRRSYTTGLDYDPATGSLLGKTQRDWNWTPGCTGTKCKDEVHTETSYTLTPTAYSTTGTGQHQRTGHNGEAVTHDPNGNITSLQLAADPTDKTLRKLTWDADDRLTSIVDAPSGSGGAATRYSYDHTGTLTVDDTGSPTFFVNPWVSYTNNTLTTHVFADGQRLAARTGPDLTWLHQDGNGNTHLTTDADGQITQRQEYFPNGQTWLQQTSDHTTRYGFSGELTDTTHGISDFGQRWYDPTHQLFYSPDPAPRDDPGTLVGDPQMTGSYTLNHHNSYRYTDPDGRDPDEDSTSSRVAFHRLLGMHFLEKSDPAPPILADTAPIQIRLGVESDSDSDSDSGYDSGYDGGYDSGSDSGYDGYDSDDDPNDTVRLRTVPKSGPFGFLVDSQDAGGYQSRWRQLLLSGRHLLAPGEEVDLIEAKFAGELQMMQLANWWNQQPHGIVDRSFQLPDIAAAAFRGEWSTATPQQKADYARFGAMAAAEPRAW